MDDTWHNTDSEFAKTTGILAYIVGHSTFFDWYIQISTNKRYDYYFTDESNDEYKLAVRDPTSTHIVRYDSSKPTIIRVAGK